MGIELLIFTGRKGPGGLQSSNKGRKRERLSGAGDKIKWIDIGLKTGQFVRFWKVEGKTLYRWQALGMKRGLWLQRLSFAFGRNVQRTYGCHAWMRHEWLTISGYGSSIGWFSLETVRAGWTDDMREGSGKAPLTPDRHFRERIYETCHMNNDDKNLLPLQPVVPIPSWCILAMPMMIAPPLRSFFMKVASVSSVSTVSPRNGAPS